MKKIHRSRVRTWIILFCFLTSLIIPVVSDTRYYSGGPDLTATIDGTNELTPGEEKEIIVKIGNRGVVDMTLSQKGSLSPEVIPTTARFTTVSLTSGETPLVIRSGAQKAGDLESGETQDVQFTLTVPSDCPAGTYTLPLKVSYQYLKEAEQIGLDTLRNQYKSENITIPLTVTVKPVVDLTVTNFTSSGLYAGSEGYLSITVKNTGDETGSDTIFRIIRNGNSPVYPTDDSIYIGRFTPGETVQVRFKVSISRDAESKTYPLDLMAVYNDSKGSKKESEKTSLGIPVKGKITFKVTGPPAEVNPGRKSIIEVVYENTGETTAYDAQARISAVDPFTSNDDTAYLGELKPHEKATGRFEVNVGEGAITKTYIIDSEVRYRDELDNDLISDTVRVQVNVGSSVSSFPWIIIGILIIGGGIGVFYYKRRTR